MVMSNVRELAAKAVDPGTSFLTRIEAIKGLAALGNDEAVDIIREALADHERLVRREAVKALARIADPDAIDALVEALEAEDEDTQQYAAEALGEMGAPQALDGLSALTQSKSFFVKAAAERALKQIREKQQRETQESQGDAGADDGPDDDAGDPSEATVIGAGDTSQLDDDTPPPTPAKPTAARQTPSTQTLAPARPADGSEVSSIDSSEVESSFNLARLVAQAFKAKHVRKDKERADKLSVLVRISGGRKQVVQIIAKRQDSEGAPLITLYTPCGPAKKKLLADCLRYSLRMAFGAIAIHDIQGRAVLVVVDTLHGPTTHPDALRTAVKSVAKHADRIEKFITNKDEA
jgi:hypothetical protein